MRIGWIGMGTMGLPMATHLRAAGHEVCVHTRTRVRAQPLLDAGASWAASPAEAAASADVSFCMVGFPDEVREVHLGSNGLLAGARSGAMLIDMSTSPPAMAIEIAQRAAARQVRALDAPVTGGDIGAREARLSILVGGEAESFQVARPLFELMGSTVVHFGPAGAGQHAKMVNQLLVAASMLAIDEALRYGRAAGLDPALLQKALAAGAGGNWSLSNLLPRALTGDDRSGFRARLLEKDLLLAREWAQANGLKLEGLERGTLRYQALVASGGAPVATQGLWRDTLGPVAIAANPA